MFKSTSKTHLGLGRKAAATAALVGAAGAAFVGIGGFLAAPAGAATYNAGTASCSLTGETPYIHTDTLGRNWIYGHGAAYCYGESSATVWNAVLESEGSSWVVVGESDSGIRAYTNDDVLADGYCSSSGSHVFMDESWINLTDAVGRHYTVVSDSREVRLGCSA
jgi:hypothetical protein